VLDALHGINIVIFDVKKFWLSHFWRERQKHEGHEVHKGKKRIDFVGFPHLHLRWRAAQVQVSCPLCPLCLKDLGTWATKKTET
jgi:hypothetical protein